jgi:hypothetical protein
VLRQVFQIFFRPNVFDSHREEFVAAVPIVCDGGVINREKLQGVLIAQPHRARMCLEEQSILLGGFLQRFLRAMTFDQASDLDQKFFVAERNLDVFIGAGAVAFNERSILFAQSAQHHHRD